MTSAFGAFGKIPSAGDFFRIEAPKGFVTAWDDWLQQGIIDTRGALAEDWNDKYLTAPIWRFSLSGGLAGEQGALGVLMPSVDRVGRQFPLTLMTQIDGGSAISNHFLCSDLFEDMEEVALEALDEDASRDTLTERLGELDATLPSEASTRTENGRLVVGPAHGHAIVSTLAARFAEQSFKDPSVWSAEVDGGQRMLLCEGLPSADEILGLYDLDAPIWSEAQAA